MEVEPFTLCADDYGLSPEIDAGILQLLRQQRLGAVSCLVGAPRWTDAAVSLARFAGRVDIGLHLNLTHAFPGWPAWRLPGIILRAGLHLLPVAQLERDIGRQVEAFELAMGRLPDYLDGHQHVHQLPQVREVLLRQIDRHWPGARKPWVRLSWSRRWRGAKAALIGALGAGQLRWRLREEGILCNPDFAGVYSLSPAADYRRLMQYWLTDLAPGGLIMCHPGRLPLSSGDQAARHWGGALAGAAIGGHLSLALARQHELEYLCGSEFESDCRSAGRLAVRFRPHRLE